MAPILKSHSCSWISICTAGDIYKWNSIFLMTENHTVTIEYMKIKLYVHLFLISGYDFTSILI